MICKNSNAKDKHCPKVEMRDGEAYCLYYGYPVKVIGGRCRA